MKDYIRYMEELTKAWSNLQWKEKEREKKRQEILAKIHFFQHERMVHLIVTVTFAILLLMAVGINSICPSIPVFVLELLLLVLLIPYIRHYYILENGVQKLYHLYDRTERLNQE